MWYIFIIYMSSALVEKLPRLFLAPLFESFPFAPLSNGNQNIRAAPMAYYIAVGGKKR